MTIMFQGERVEGTPEEIYRLVTLQNERIVEWSKKLDSEDGDAIPSDNSNS